MRDNQLTLTLRGQEILERFKTDRGAGYDALFAGLVSQHAYLRKFISVLNQQDIVAPVITSMEEHVSSRYATNVALAEAVAKRRFDPEEMLDRIGQRIGRQLEDHERAEIADGVEELVRDALSSALGDDTTRFAKSFLEKSNGIVIPAIFRKAGMGFDYRTHRALWAIGHEFKLWTVIRSHPAYNAWLIVRTSTICLNEQANALASVSFDYGLDQTGNGFLGKLFLAYQDVQKIRSGTFVAAWELRAVFCTRFRCQPTVFNTLLDQSYDGSGEYALQLEIQRQKPQHETRVRARNRNIGSKNATRLQSSLRQRCGISSDGTPTAFGASGESCPSSPVDRQRAASSSPRGGVSVLVPFWILPPHTPLLQFTVLTRRKTGVSQRHSRQCTNQLDLPARQCVGLPCSRR